MFYRTNKKQSNCYPAICHNPLFSAHDLLAPLTESILDESTLSTDNRMSLLSNNFHPFLKLGNFENLKNTLKIKKQSTLKFDFRNKIIMRWYCVYTFTLPKIPYFYRIVLTACCYLIAVRIKI